MAIRATSDFALARNPNLGRWLIHVPARGAAAPPWRAEVAVRADRLAPCIDTDLLLLLPIDAETLALLKAELTVGSETRVVEVRADGAPERAYPAVVVAADAL